MTVIGFEFVRQALNLVAIPVRGEARAGGYTAIQRLADGSLGVPRQVAPADASILRHLLFGLRHEYLELPILALAVHRLDPAELLAELRAAPTGRFIRQLCFLYEAFTRVSLDIADVDIAGPYVPLFDPAKHFVGETQRNAKWRVDYNGLADLRYCPIIRRTPEIEALIAGDLLLQAREFAIDVGPELLDRALSWAYLSETENSFEIERDKPDATKAESFVRLLKQAHARRALSEEYLVELQNSAISNPLERAVQFRTAQNWLHDAAPGAAGVTYVPPPPDLMMELMTALMEFGNRPPPTVDPLIVAALVSFGFVLIHPFMDGNGRLSRFLFHHALCVSGQQPDGFLLPVSIAMKKADAQYLAALQSFSRPAREFWRVQWGGDVDYTFEFKAGAELYRYWNATPMVEFSLRMAEQSMTTFLRNEVAYLQAYAQAFKAMNESLDIRNSSLALLLRVCFASGGRLSKHRRKQYADHVPSDAFDRIETAVQQARTQFGLAER